MAVSGSTGLWASVGAAAVVVSGIVAVNLQRSAEPVADPTTRQETAEPSPTPSTPPADVETAAVEAETASAETETGSVDAEEPVAEAEILVPEPATASRETEMPAAEAEVTAAAAETSDVEVETQSVEAEAVAGDTQTQAVEEETPVAETGTPPAVVAATEQPDPRPDETAQQPIPPVADTDVAAPFPEEPEDSAQSPALDVIRVENDGAALFAGRAEGGADVSLQLDGQEIARVQADAQGNFVSMLDLPQSDSPQVLTVEATIGTGAPKIAEDAIIIAPSVQPDAQAAADISPAPSQPNPETAFPPTETSDAPSAAASAPSAPDPLGNATDATPETDTVNLLPDGAPDADVAALDQPVATPASPDLNTTAPAAVSDAPGSPDVAPIATAAATLPTATIAPELRPAPRIFRAGPDGLRLESAPQDASPSVSESLGLDAIAYSADGEVQLTGRGAPDTQLQVYLDNRPVQSIDVGEGGVWASPLPNVDEGVYTLRIDAISSRGAVVSRIETPFKRTAPEIAASARAEGASALTVQPGFTLWALSEGYFGDGFQYVQLFQANRDQIRDPDLIYPGQVLKLPEDEG